MSDNGYEKMSLPQRQKKLEEMIVCPHGKGQVYLRNFIEPNRRQGGPQLALRCKIRELLGVKPAILGLEEIVLTCCRDPLKTCEVYRRYRERAAAG